MMTNEVSEWCRRQCEIQHATTDADFAGMEAAWEFAVYMNKYPVSIGAMRDMAAMIDHEANPNGAFRTGPAVFMDGGVASNAEGIERYLASWVECLSIMTPEEAYRELMYIHPFKDGNGRVGALVYNILNGTILNPVDPPEYK